MKKNKKVFDIVTTIFGAALLLAGLVLAKLDASDSVPYLFVGFGCGIFGHGFGALIQRRNAKKYPAYAKEQEILRTDERNVAIANAAKAKAFDLMIYVFGALFAAFALMGVDVKVILLLVAAYLFVCGAHIFYRVQYEKKM